MPGCSLAQGVGLGCRLATWPDRGPPSGAGWTCETELHDVTQHKCLARKGTLSLCEPITACKLALCGLRHCWPRLAASLAWRGAARSHRSDASTEVQPKMVKIYGAGGFQGLEAYQSGMLISPEGHILTVWSHVLDTDVHHGHAQRRPQFEAKLLGADPRLEVAVLKIEAPELPCFDLAKAVEVEAGARVLAFSNLFGVATGDEPASVQHGTISPWTQLEARRGVFETPYHGPVYVLDVMTNNPGAAGGALVTCRGELVAMLGKELRNTLNNTWLNYALPIAELRKSVEEIRARQVRRPARGRDGEEARPAAHLDRLGMVLVPDVVERTPPYVDRVRPGSPAAEAGIRPDDLMVLVGDRLVHSCKCAAGRTGVHRLRGPGEADRAPRPGDDRIRAQPPADEGIAMMQNRPWYTRRLLHAGICRGALASRLLRTGGSFAIRAIRRRPRPFLAVIALLGLALAAVRGARGPGRARTAGLPRGGRSRGARAWSASKRSAAWSRSDGCWSAPGPTTGLIVDPRGLRRSPAPSISSTGPPRSWSGFPTAPASRPGWWPPTHNRMLVLLKIDVDRAAAGAGDRAAEARCGWGNGRSPWAGPSRATGPTCRWESSAPWDASGARPSRPTPPSRPTTTAAR